MRKENNMELIALQDLDLQVYKNEYEKIRSIAPKLQHRGVKIYISKDDYIKHKDVIETKLQTNFTMKNQSPIIEMLKQRGLSIKTFNRRVRRGWSYEHALNTPKGDKNPAHVRKKRVTQFTGGIAGGSGGSIMRGADKLVLAKPLNKLGDIAEFMGIKPDSEIQHFNEKENESFYIRNKKVSKKGK